MIPKFRAWDEEANIMVYSDHRTRKLYDVYYGFEMNGKGLLECHWEGDYTESHVLDGGTLDNIMQYTGLKDKNGVEIFEGDIVSDQYANIYTPIFRNGIYMAYNVEYLHLTEQEPSTQFNVVWKNGCEIIGDIYEKPELLEKGENR